ncbi:MAG: TonB-dependent receptor plug domain-containing protein [Saccharospirillaceae bacterium]|nr:TonB-dependent receptor plug domain-containing protein [Saccharospirillaceae bacterium]
MKKTPLSLLVLLAPLTPLSALAADDVTLSTQTVQADFRKADVQQIPEAVTLVGSEQIEARSAQHLEQILSFAPNVNFASGASRGRYYQIRGIGERSQFVDPVNPSVGLVIDGIDMTGLGAAATLFDVQQVEILRGPQGTRFGANALAGMINIRSNDPTQNREGYISAEAGNYSSYGLGAALSGSLSDHLQGRIAVQGFESDGYIDNEFLNRDDTNNQDEKNRPR